MRPFVVASLALSAFGIAHAQDFAAQDFAAPQDFHPSAEAGKATQQADSTQFQQPSSDMPNPFGDAFNMDFLKNLKEQVPEDPKFAEKAAEDNLMRYFLTLGQEKRIDELNQPELKELVESIKDYKENAFDDIRGSLRFFNDEKNAELRSAILSKLNPFKEQFAQMEKSDQEKLEEETMKMFRQLFSEDGGADSWFQDFAKMFEGLGLDGQAHSDEL